ncbi:aminotransferase class I/II-fold pyridoxal phosphate-dependent enzyme [Streptomyces sp. BPTC-684]|uniref:aminotransferase class I/II-fold pyridoxal phosphate-dependent enzyme n=1 Tax=Streptomyces sp. BPTC-684 TaxID=3043734 RepID=UPI0024B208A8|nr:aminotransferase class I/II-fold pyridoxal phosphate-dependent enzyme [Streptomyces sp. BPTC-684]WHM40861.1 aminotransferase class I/II-fold pyridoxal phosphate-dependent enzyme [Streptomyces sp. BPTC-684]
MASHPKSPSTRPGIQGRSTDELLALLAAAADPERRLAAHQELFPDVTNLATAENVLVYPSLREHVFSALGTIEGQDAKYTTAYGSESLRKGIADMLRPLFSQELDWRDVFGTSGVSAALECLAFALKDADVLRDGDRVLLPAPYWQGFNWCFEQRPGLLCVPAHLKDKGAENFELTLEDLKHAYRTQPEQPKLLVLTNPNNPLGVNYEKELLEEIYTWALTETGMHIISDEMYAHSRLTGSAPEFVSALALDAYREIDGARERVHVVWGFAKDFGMSGFKAGVIVSRSPAVHLAMTGVPDKQETLSWFSPFDSLKHFVIGRMLQTRVGDKSYPLELMEQYRGLLTTACDTVRRELDKHGFTYRFRKGQNTAQFLWLDLRRYLPKLDAPEIPAHAGPHFPQPDRIPGEFAGEGGKTDAVTLPLLFPEIDSREEWLRWALANHAQVQLLPGQLLSCAEPGYFRLCFTAVETPEVVKSVQRMAAFLH